jgi:hypothetical protein
MVDAEKTDAVGQGAVAVAATVTEGEVPEFAIRK